MKNDPEFKASIEKKVRESANAIYSKPGLTRNLEASEAERKDDKEEN